MPEPVIQVQNLSKRYRIGLRERRAETLVAALSDAVRRPLQNLRNLRRLSHFRDNEKDDVIWALRDVSFNVGQGEVVGIIGRNGAGKSTLLKILTRITEPTSGQAVIHGRVGSLLEVGTGFHPDLTGRDNTYLNGTILGMTRKEIDRKFDEIVEFSGVEKFIDTPVKRYSSGMRVRLAFAVAAHLEPEVLLVDEVLAVGDAEFQEKCLGKMESVAEKGRTVLLVSHQMPAILHLCHNAILIDQGQVKLYGRANEVVQTYLSNAHKHAEDDSHFPIMSTQYQVGFTHCYVDVSPQIERNSIDLEVRFGVIADAAWENVGVGIGLSTTFGAKVTQFGPRFTDSYSYVIDKGTNNFVIECKDIGRLLTPGIYVMRLWLVTAGKGMLIDVESIAVVNIPDINFYGTGKSPSLKGMAPLCFR